MPKRAGNFQNVASMHPYPGHSKSDDRPGPLATQLTREFNRRDRKHRCANGARKVRLEDTRIPIQHGLVSPKNPRGFLSCSKAERADHVSPSGEICTSRLSQPPSACPQSELRPLPFRNLQPCRFSIESRQPAAKSMPTSGYTLEGWRRPESMRDAACASSGRSLHFR